MIEKGNWLEHMFILPEYTGIGIGTCLFRHMYQRCLEGNINKLSILAEPNAKGFYDKMGCSYITEYPSTIKNRTTPLFELRFVE